MAATLNIHDILSKVKKLDKDDQLTLLEKIVAIIRKDETLNKPEKLSKISGIGSKVWKGTNIDEYIERERKW